MTRRSRLVVSPCAPLGVTDPPSTPVLPCIAAPSPTREEIPMTEVLRHRTTVDTRLDHTLAVLDRSLGGDR